MRPLTEEETKTFFEKLAKIIGRDIKSLIDRQDEKYCFRLHKDRVYYVSERMMRIATNIGTKQLVSLGTCFGKFTKSNKFHLKITALDYLAQYAKYKVWVKPSSEMTFLYGNHITKGGVARMTEGIPQYAGVVVFSMNNQPLGFGVSSQTTERARELDATATVVLHQADVGEYLRVEEDLS
eukprot:gb/GECG01006018.1/.p1 GENE.gb/GECG01006018.1/~~gb/GECG01006018.1/.p1  ORF type:complete len:181 (+),score=19.70 gb/GECG01006018.1/:1-543(+)